MCARVAVAVSMALLAGCDQVGSMTDRLRDRQGDERSVVAVPVATAAAAPVVSGSASWDGVPSLGGVWVAHPDTVEPARVRIARVGGGPSVEGWLFGRAAGGEGPALQVSSEAAVALGLAAGQRAVLEVEPLQDATAPESG